MKNQELFNKTLNILVKAYQNDTLQHQYCSACAVGNIVAANNDYKVVRNKSLFINKKGEEIYTYWDRVFMTEISMQKLDPEEYSGLSKEQIDSTGYAWQDLAKIEYAFETVSKGKSDDEWMFNGLLAVYDVLCEIHEVENKQDATLIFVK